MSGCPRFGNIFVAHIDIAGEQRLQGNGRILIIVVFYFVKIKEAFAGGEVFCPVIRIPDKRDVTSGFKVFILYGPLPSGGVKLGLSYSRLTKSLAEKF